MNASDDPGTLRRRSLYGRRRGKPPRPGRRALLDRLLPALEIDLGEFGPGGLDPRTLFDAPVTEVWLEIGFGNGEHLMTQSAAHPGVGIIGAEPYLAGVARLISYIHQHRLRNIRLFVDDARLLLDVLSDASLGRVFTLFPDPWPKTRHHKRRLVQPDVVETMARILKPGGRWRLATDDMGYCRWILRHLTARADFTWTAAVAEDWRRRPADWPETRYEAKARHQGRSAVYLEFERQAG